MLLQHYAFLKFEHSHWWHMWQKNARILHKPCLKMKCLQILLFNDFSAKQMLVVDKVFRTVIFLLFLHSFRHVAERYNILLSQKNNTIQYNLDTIAALMINGHLKFRVGLKKGQSAQPPFCQNLTFCRWDLGYPGPLLQMLLLPHRTQC